MNLFKGSQETYQKTGYKNLVCTKQNCSAQEDFYHGTEMEDRYKGKGTFSEP